MARLASTALAGYYPVLMELVPSLAALVQLQPGKAHYVCDPCAGAGEGIEGLVRCWTSTVRGMDDTKVTPLLCELEKSRYDLLMGRVNNALSPLYNNASHYHKAQYIHGDAFKVGWKEDFEGVNVLWLNPPYADDNDGFKIDKDDKKTVAHRLEEEFLQHFHNLIAIGGALMFFVPYHALKWSAATLARHFEEITCYRMPEPIFTDYYKQVVLVARKRPALHQPDPLLQAMIEEWAADSSCIPVLPINGVDSSGARVDPMVVTSDSDGRWGSRVENAGWKILPFNVGAVLRTAKLWYAPSRGGELQPIEAVIPGGSFKDLFARQYPLAMPPRATHIGAAISAGVMGGVRLVPNDKSESAYLPVLYIGGHFEKAFKTVEERTNKEGEVSWILQIEQPILKITVLDTRAATYITLKNEVAESDATDVKDFTAGDLLKHYGDSMVTELKKRCPALYDPSDESQLIEVPVAEGRTRFEAQEHAARACLKQLQQGPDYSAILVGEVGSGKTGLSLTCAQMMQRDHVLVMAPPHLGSTWKTQVEASWPGARAMMLETTVDMDDFVRHQNGRVFVSGRPGGSKLDGHSGPVVGVLSRETAKLGHRYVGIRNGAWKGERAASLLEGQNQLLETGYCPKCGTPIYDAPDDLAKRRARCKAKFLRGSNKWAEWVRRISIALVPLVPSNAEVAEKLTGRGEQLYLARRRVIQAERNKAKEPLFTSEECTRSQRILGGIALEMAPAMVKMAHGFYTKAKEPHPMRAFVRIMLGAGNDAAIYNAIFAFWEEAKRQAKEDYSRRELFNLAKSMLVLLADDAIYAEAKATLERDEPTTSSANYYGNHQNSWKEIEANRKRIWHPGQDTDSNGWNVSIGAESITFDSATKQPRIDNHQFRSVNLAITAIRELSGVATYIEDTDKCDEPLYQAYARPLGKGTLADDECDKVAPRRIALAQYFSKRLKKHLKRGKWMLITDEVHELANNEDSAQSKAAQQLWNLKMPTIAMTGSIMNGYPSSIFILLWSLSSDFRKEFGRGESARYSKTYGYQKQLIVIEKGTSKVKEFGAFSDKTEDDSKRAKNAGFSPGMLPASTLKHALRKSVTLQLRDIAKSLPPCHFKVERIEPTKEQGERAVSLLTRIHDQIKKDRFTKDSGKLMGALTEAPSFLDRCIEGVGNQEDGSWVSAYPDDRIVWQFPGFSADSRLPKEKWLLNYLDNQLAAGRDVIVLAWHLNLLPRLRTIIEKDLHVLAPILYSDKVAPKNREAWIQKELDGKGARVFLCNPVSISTGLNALTRFNSVAWLESPVSSAHTFRQANGRVVRIGQRREQELVTAVYGYEQNSKANVQMLLHKLLMLKVGVSEGIEGLDPTAALQAAGVGDQDALAGRDIGRLISSMLDGDDMGLRVLQREFLSRLSSTTDHTDVTGSLV